MDLAFAPMHRRAAVEWHVKVFAKGGAQRRLEAALDADLFQHGREEVAAGGVENLGERACFRLDPRQLRPGVLEWRPGSAFGRAGIDDRLFGLRYRGLGFFQQRDGLFDQELFLGGSGSPATFDRMSDSSRSTSASCARSGRGARRCRAASVRSGCAKRRLRPARRSARQAWLRLRQASMPPVRTRPGC